MRECTECCLWEGFVEKLFKSTLFLSFKLASERSSMEKLIKILFFSWTVPASVVAELSPTVAD